MSAPHDDHPTDETRSHASIVRQVSPRADLLVFAIDAKLHTEDMQWMAEQISGAYAVHEQIDILLLFKPFRGATAGALIEPKALMAETAALAKVRRYAVVGAPDWAEAMINLGDKVSPVDAATFSDEAAAWVWIDRD